MSLRVRFFTILVVLGCFTLGAHADTVYVWPNFNFSPTVNTYDSESLGASGNYTIPGVAIGLDSTPDGTRNYTISRVDNEAVTLTDENQSVVFRSGQWNSPGEDVVVTPDGKYALALGGLLVVYDAATGNQVASVSTGSSPIDFAVSIDSSYVLVVSANTRRVFKVDLTTLAVEDELEFAGSATALAAGPNCLFYLSTTNAVLVIDGEELEVVDQISVTGTPNKLYFTPNGRYGIAANSDTVTNASVWVFDLINNSITIKKDTLFLGTIRVRLTPRIEVVSNDRFIMTSKTNKIMYEVAIPSGNLKVFSPSGIPSPDDVEGIVKSGEYPAAKYLYFLEVTSLHKADLANDSVQGGSVLVPNNVTGLDISGAASTNTPTDAILYNDSQSIELEAEFRPVVVRALDADGKPVFGAQVEWTAPEGAVIFTAMNQTNKDGLAKAVVIVNDITGPVPVQALIGNVLLKTFNLSIGTGGGGPGSTGFSIFSGQGQLVGDSAFIFAGPLEVQLKNPDGSPIEDQNVEWAITMGRGGLGQETPSDENGIATARFFPVGITPGVSFAQTIVTATYGAESLDFYITTYPSFQPDLSAAPPPQVIIRKPAASARDFTGEIGEIQEDAIEALVVAGTGINLGAPIPNVALVADTGNEPAAGPVVRCAPDGFAMTDEFGIVSCNLQFLGIVGQSRMELQVGGTGFVRFPNYSVTVLPGSPSGANKVQGDGQSGAAGELLPRALVVEIVDAAGTPLGGEGVTWTVLPEDGATLSDVETVTDSGGMASASVTLGNTPGPVRVQAASGAATATFLMQVLVQGTQFNLFSGSGQIAEVGGAFAAPLVVQLLDENDQGVANQTITFDVTGGSANLGSPTATTDSSGKASMTVTAGQTSGTVTIVARYGSLEPVTFTLDVIVAGPPIDADSFRNGASNVAGVVPGSVVKIIGAGLAPNVQNCVIPQSRGALPLELAGVTVQFGPDSNPMMAPIYYVCNIDGQQSVSVQAPFELTPGPVSATVQVQGGATVVENVQVLPVQPGVFETVGANGLRYAVIMRPDGSFVSPANPARRGETLCVFVTGLGATNPASGTNQAGIPGQTVTSDLVVGVNNAGVRVIGGEYAVNMIGVYAVYFEIPQDMATGSNLPFAVAVRLGEQLLFGNGSAIGGVQ